MLYNSEYCLCVRGEEPIFTLLCRSPQKSNVHAAAGEDEIADVISSLGR